MKIAFDLRRIKNPGIGRYMKCLTEAVIAQSPEHEYLLILPPEGEKIVASDCAGVERVISSASCYSLREQVELPRLLRQRKVDLLHTPHFNLPLMAPCPVVVTIHDAIYLACKRDLPSPLGRWYYRAMMTAAVRRAERIITVSEFSKREIVRFLKVDPEKIQVIHSGIGNDFNPVTDQSQIDATLSTYGIDAGYILYTGIYKPRKNHAGLMHAFREFLKTGDRAKLVIAGPMGEGEQDLHRLARELAIADRVVFTGIVPDSDLRTLYSAARVYACPSLYEGFGFTVLEAMACGVPVVCSGETSLPEVAGDAALYADPRNPQDFAAAVRRAYSEVPLRRQLIERGFRNRSRFNWQDAAISTLAVYRCSAGFGGAKARAGSKSEATPACVAPDEVAASRRNN